MIAEVKRKLDFAITWIVHNVTRALIPAWSELDDCLATCIALTVHAKQVGPC